MNQIRERKMLVWGIKTRMDVPDLNINKSLTIMGCRNETPMSDKTRLSVRYFFYDFHISQKHNIDKFMPLLFWYPKIRSRRHKARPSLQMRFIFAQNCFVFSVIQNGCCANPL